MQFFKLMRLLSNFDLSLNLGCYYIYLCLKSRPPYFLNKDQRVVSIQRAYQLKTSLMGFNVYVCYQSDAGKFCGLSLFSLYSGKHFNAIKDYDLAVLFMKIQDRIKELV